MPAPSNQNQTNRPNTHLLLNRKRRERNVMSKVSTQVLAAEVSPSTVAVSSRSWEWAKQVGIVVCASLFVALCARVTVPLPFTPVPLTMQNFGVLVVGLMLGSRRGFAALALYLAEGVAGLPVFSPSLLGGGIAQIL